jgi:hypothetical protein
MPCYFRVSQLRYKNSFLEKKFFEKVCHAVDLQPNALPTELSESSFEIMKYYLIYVMVNISICVTDSAHHLMSQHQFAMM